MTDITCQLVLQEPGGVDGSVGDYAMKLKDCSGPPPATAVLAWLDLSDVNSKQNLLKKSVALEALIHSLTSFSHQPSEMSGA